tara:strand:- start:4301 stop:5098 length:798 start_codon:yes stop_codon:yes gene_type:complete
MKKYLVIGNPIEHSLSPRLHNHWFKKNNIEAIYQKKQINENDLKGIIDEIRNDKIHGVNVTIPFKQLVIPLVDDLSFEAKESQSVNTICKEKNKIVGHNTDINGFELALRSRGFNIKNKKIFILGAGGVVPSIILSLKKLDVRKIIITNRTKTKAENLKKFFTNLEIVEWGTTPDFDMIINATSLGLNKNDVIDLNYEKIGSNKIFYDVIYNPIETNFLLKAKKFGNKTENGKMMFIYQAHQSFTIWNKLMPKIDDETIKLLEND